MLGSHRFGGQQRPTGDQAQRARRRLAALEAAGLSRSDFARRAGVANSTVTKVANDANASVSARVARAILGVR